MQTLAVLISLAVRRVAHLLMSAPESSSQTLARSFSDAAYAFWLSDQTRTAVAMPVRKSKKAVL